MSVDKLTAQTKDVGGIPVARILPNTRGRRTIGAWCFLDHAGPAEFGDDSLGLQVGLHPHTHLQTFTWMLSGEVVHQDSLGNKQVICPKQVNLMTAGTTSATGENTALATPSKRPLKMNQPVMIYTLCNYGLPCQWIKTLSRVFIIILTCRHGQPKV